MTEESKKPEGGESGEKKPKVKGRRLSTSIKGGVGGGNYTDACVDSGGDGGGGGGGGGGGDSSVQVSGNTYQSCATGWGCTRSCNGFVGG